MVIALIHKEHQFILEVPYFPSTIQITTVDLRDDKKTTIKKILIYKQYK